MPERAGPRRVASLPLPGDTAAVSPGQATAERIRQGFAALDAGNLAAAAACARELLARDSQFAPAHFLVALTALQAGERKVAFDALAATTRLDPTHDAAWAHLARLWLGEGAVDEAATAIDRAVQYDRGNPMVHDLIGTVKSLLGQYQDARSWYERAVQERPGQVPFLQNLANNQVYLGELATAEATFHRILAIEPDNAQTHWSLAGARTARDDAHIRVMRKVLAAGATKPGGLHPRAMAFLQYAIGKECEDLQRWEDAWIAFAAGAAARRSTVAYDEALEEQTFATLSAAFAPGWNQQRPGYADDGPAPVFIIGQPRTGTTLIERILAAHPAVHAAGELQHFHLALRRLTAITDPRRFTPALFEQARHLDPAVIGRTYLDSVRRLRGGGTVFLDKLPQNYLHVPLILAALPRARIIHLTRDPMDACFASFKQLFADAYLHSYTLGEMARHYVRYHRLMATWRAGFPDGFLDIAYEDAVANVEATARRMLQWIGLPWNDACIRFHHQSGAVATASAAQVREPAHARSVGRWKRYAHHLEPMRETLEDAGVIPRSAEISG